MPKQKDEKESYEDTRRSPHGKIKKYWAYEIATKKDRKRNK